jgi:hypothetical protein
MEKLAIKYRLSGKALPPRRITMKLPGWAGSPELRMENGSQPQPWHCKPFTDASTYGLELLYQYETECHVINDAGTPRIEWDYMKEPGGIVAPTEFSFTVPKPPKFYSFATSIDIQAPPGYVVRVEPHPRFYTDESNSAPGSINGHLPSWWPKNAFVVFKVPPPGHRHMFRKGEPYAQVIFVPETVEYDLQRMTPQEEAARRDLDDRIFKAKEQIANNVWHNPGGAEFSDHYKVLGRAHARGGIEAVEQVVDKAVDELRKVFPEGKTAEQYLELADQLVQQGKYNEAKTLYFHVRDRDVTNPHANSGLGVVAAALGLNELSLQMLRQALAVAPNVPGYHANTAETLRRMGRLSEAEAELRAALALSPRDPRLLAILGHMLVQQNRHPEARTLLQAALAIDPNLAAAKSALQQLGG